RIDSLPEGTWTMVVRAIGHSPTVSLVDALTDSRGPVTTIVMPLLAQPLDTVNVVAPASSADRAVLVAIENRMRVAAGTLIRADNPSLRSATDASQALAAARGFVYKGLTS